MTDYKYGGSTDIESEGWPGDTTCLDLWRASDARFDPPRVGDIVEMADVFAWRSAHGWVLLATVPIEDSPSAVRSVPQSLLSKLYSLRVPGRA